jgi:hypothetical protein
MIAAGIPIQGTYFPFPSIYISKMEDNLSICHRPANMEINYQSGVIYGMPISF